MRKRLRENFAGDRKPHLLRGLVTMLYTELGHIELGGCLVTSSEKS